MTRPPVPGTQGYSAEAPNLLQRYERMRFGETHHGVLDLIPPAPLDFLDIGAGTGRDAAWFAARGDRVAAIEPTREMREGAMALHPTPGIEWIDDHLPGLVSVRARTFDLVWMSAIWMHFNVDERAAMMPVVAALVRRGGNLMTSLRHGPVPEGRRMFSVSVGETTDLARRAGLENIRIVESDSIDQQGVTWSRLWFRKPG